MSSNAIAGVGTKFWRRMPVAPFTWEVLAEVNTIQGPGMSRDAIDVTSLDSTLGYREYIGGFKDGENCTLSMNMTFENYEKLLEDFQYDGTVWYYLELTQLAGNPHIDFHGIVVNMPTSVVADDRVTLDVTIKVSGEVTLGS